MRSLVSKFDSVKSNKKVPSIFCTSCRLSHSLQSYLEGFCEFLRSADVDRNPTALALTPALQLLNGSLLFTFLEGCCWPGTGNRAVEHIEWKRGGSVEEVLRKCWECVAVYFDGFCIFVFLLVNSNSFSLQTPRHHDLWMWFGQVYGKRGLLCCSH